MENIGYLDFSVVNNTLFSYDSHGEHVQLEFDPMEPQKCIETIATVIQQNGLTRVICNKLGYGLCGSISQQLKAKYNNNNCFFELND